MVIRNLETTDAVIEELGGTGAVAKLLGCSPTRVSNWRNGKSGRGRFPPELAGLRAHIEARGCTAPSDLWGIKPLPEPASEAAE